MELTMWGKVVTGVASTSDKMLHASTVAKIVEEKSPKKKIALVRVLPWMVQKCSGNAQLQNYQTQGGEKDGKEAARMIYRNIKLRFKYLTATENYRRTKYERPWPIQMRLPWKVVDIVKMIEPKVLVKEVAMIVSEDEVPSVPIPPGGMEGANVQVKVMVDGSTNEKTAHKIGPTCSFPTHYSNGTGELSAAAKGRIEGKQPPFQPSARMSAKLKAIADAILVAVYPEKAVREWKDGAECKPLKDLCSSKWSAHMYGLAYQSLVDRGDSFSVNLEAQIKSEVLGYDEHKGHRPRIIINAGPEAQIAGKIVTKCVEELWTAHFADFMIKHKPKIEAVMEMMGHVKESDRFMESDGSAWDATICSRLKDILENRILFHVGKILYADGDWSESLEMWWKKDMEQRTKKKVAAKFCKGGAMARLCMTNTRMSGDALTSIGNAIVNMSLWAAVVLDHPQDFIRQPYLNKYKSNGVADVQFRPNVEGDDGAVVTSTNMTVEAIEAEWKSLGFNMKIFERKKGDQMIFVGMQALRTTEGATCPLPEIARGIKASRWTVGEVSPEFNCMRFVARMQLNKESELMCGYYRRIALWWREQIKADKPQVIMDADTQFKVHGEFKVDRKCDIDAVLETVYEHKESARATVVGAIGEEEYKLALEKMQAFGTIGPDVNPMQVFPPSFLS